MPENTDTAQSPEVTTPTPETTPQTNPSPEAIVTESATQPVVPETPQPVETAAPQPEVAGAPTPVAPQVVATPPTLPEAQPQLSAGNPKNHVVALLLSIFLGGLGVDRFYLGQVGLGVAKLLLSWLTFGIWWLVDVILIASKKVNGVTWEN